MTIAEGKDMTMNGMLYYYGLSKNTIHAAIISYNAIS